jgi:ethanolamine utilization protein EutA
LPADPAPQALTFSGGVSEFIFQREDADFGDLGQPFAKAIRNALSRGTFGLPAIIDPNLGIRATAVGASQFNVQGGVNAYVSDEAILPLMNVPVLLPRVELEGDVTAGAVAASIQAALTRADLTDGEQPVALSFSVPGADLDEALLQALAEGIRSALPSTAAGAANLVIVVNQGVSNLFVEPGTDFHVFKQQPAAHLGRLLREELGVACEIVAMEGIHVAEFDFIDIAQVVHPSEVVPVTIKSLLFAGGLDRRSVKQALHDAALRR